MRIDLTEGGDDSWETISPTENVIVQPNVEECDQIEAVIELDEYEIAALNRDAAVSSESQSHGHESVSPPHDDDVILVIDEDTPPPPAHFPRIPWSSKNAHMLVSIKCRCIISFRVRSVH
jgi:hypothetical protein